MRAGADVLDAGHDGRDARRRRCGSCTRAAGRRRRTRSGVAQPSPRSSPSRRGVAQLVAVGPARQLGGAVVAGEQRLRRSTAGRCPGRGRCARAGAARAGRARARSRARRSPARSRSCPRRSPARGRRSTGRRLSLTGKRIACAFGAGVERHRRARAPSGIMPPRGAHADHALELRARSSVPSRVARRGGSSGASRRGGRRRAAPRGG